MLKFFKFFLGFLSLILLLFLINISFFSADKTEGNRLSFLSENKQQNDVKELSLASGALKAYNTKINFFDNIFHTKEDSFEIEYTLDNINIKLNSGVFILDLNDLSKKYSISSEKSNFNIDLKSIGSLFVDNSADRIVIFSIDSSFVLNFLNNKSKHVNSYFVYPHEFIKFDYTLNYKYENTDLYRIKTITKNGYFKYSISKDLENEFQISPPIGKQNLDFFSYYVENKVSESHENSGLYKKLNSLENLVFPFSHYIDKYSYYFVNNSKKIVYLQNSIYNKLIDLFDSKQTDVILVNSIKGELEKLKNLDEEKYEKAVHTINTFYKIVVLENKLKGNQTLNNFLLLRSEGKNIKEVENYINLKSIYFHLDFGDLESPGGYFNLFLDSYLSKSGIKEENENFTLNKKEKLSEIESFVFFLREYMHSSLFSDTLDKLSSETHILSKYINLNKMIYFSGKTSDVRIKTSLSQNLEILQNLEVFLRSNFFEKKRQDDTELLILKENKINIKEIKAFEKEIDNFFSIFNLNKYVLEKVGDNQTIKQYENIYILIKEEFFAINDYDKYTLENNKKLKDLYNLATLSSKGEKIYDKNYIINYLSVFEGLEFDSKNITKNKDTFVIKNISILGKSYDMHLNPSLGNVVKIFNEDTSVSYDLNNMEVLLKEKLKGSSEEDRHQYEFKNFFIQRFKKSSLTGNTSSYDKCYFENKIPDGKGGCREIANDNPGITVIKRDRLISGEFNTIKDFFSIEYKDLYVLADGQIDGQIGDIKILNSNIHSVIKLNGKDEVYDLELSSGYDLEKHEFNNIIIKVKDTKNKGLYLYSEAEFEFTAKKVELKSLKGFIDDFLKNLKNIDSLYSVLRGEMIPSSLKISYINKEVHIKFENKGKNINIVFEGDTIKSIKVDRRNVLENEISLSDLPLVLDKLK